ncbi:MAG: nuclear transport factor 2 family protein [Betaproteobacteria bacterium]|nr:DUF4440 domain-containing protein [Betaproteobacteria bacterium]MDE2046826.1 nuclear transport factor 2 family protein [Betaproteobacteria bacterium]
MRALLLSITSLLLAACAATAPPAETPDTLRQQVRDTEAAFAQTMADRDHAAFTRFLSDEAVFMSGEQPLRGKAAVAAAWKRFYAAPRAPFSWRPERVEVLASGMLAQSSGPVFDANGKRIATFISVWRRESPGVWRIVFDQGCDACDCAAR